MLTPTNSMSEFGKLPPKLRLALLLEEKAKRIRQTKLLRFVPNQKQIEFYAAGLKAAKRMLMAGNQLGKTLAGAVEVAYHLTGDYPAIWNGLRFPKAIKMWAASKDAVATRDNCQRLLFGDSVEEIGTGMVPGAKIVRWRRSRSTDEALSRVYVRHKSGGISVITFKNFEQKLGAWMGPTLDFGWCDEEPPFKHFIEMMTRTNNGQLGQRIMITFTPLEGLSETVLHFVSKDPKTRGADTTYVQMGIRHVTHYTEEQKAKIIASYPEHERKARADGEPILGSGRIFTTPVETLRVQPFPIPAHWQNIIGIDLGGGNSQGAHPAAAIKLAYNQAEDIIYLTRTWREKGVTTAQHASAIRAMGGKTNGVPVAWPHDTLQTNRKSGKSWVQEYMDEDLEMLPEYAQHPENIDGTSGGNNVEESILKWKKRIEDGRFKIFAGLDDFEEEYSMFHRKDGKVVKLMDDIISAVRYAIMMIRFASDGRPPEGSIPIPQGVTYARPDNGNTDWIT